MLYLSHVVRPARPEVRRLLIERAASMLARRETVTLRSLVAGTEVSSMAVYTYFGGMPGLWGAVRQEGFTRLAARLASLHPTDDPVADLAAIGRAYARSAVASPDLYRVMFDAAASLPDPAAADAAFGVMHTALRRCVEAGRFAAGLDVAGMANQLWAAGHGVCNLVCAGVLGEEAIDTIARPLLTNLYIGAGDDPAAVVASLAAGWDGAAP